MAIPYTSSYDETIPFSDVCVQMSLATNTAQTYTLPGNATNNYVVRFGFPTNSIVFVGKNATPATPAPGGQTTTQYVEFINPGEQRYCVGGDVLSFVTPDTSARIGISVRSIP
jgi:hypothetical protein